MNIDISKYLETLKDRKTDTKARNRFEEITLPYLPYIKWNNETLIKDLDRFWVCARSAYKRKLEPDYIKLLEWIKKKEPTPTQTCGALMNKKKPIWLK